MTFDPQGRAHFGAPLSGPEGKNVLFPLPDKASGNTLPAGSIRMNDGTTYMMVAGTKDLIPTGGSWLAKVTDNPAAGWKPIDNSWRSNNPTLPDGKTPNPDYSPVTQISGYQSKADGMVYIAADSFDRSQGISMYRVDPEHVTDRGAWQPWTGDGWGSHGQQAAPLTEPNTRFGEISFREIDGKPVLTGFNVTAGPGAVEVHVGAGAPTEIFTNSTPTTIAHNDAGTTPTSVYQPYGGYILPGSTLSNLNLFVSQWNTGLDPRGVPFGAPYDTQQIQVNPNR
ncbi:DUF4185 domain-containing protein [Mycobacterium sp. MUNTM1]